MADGIAGRLRRAVGRALGRDGASTSGQSPAGPGHGSGDDRTGRRGRDGGRGSGVTAPLGTRAYPGDFSGMPAMAYAPKPDGQPDPGEIVWTWVPFEEDHTVGKDRPVLVVASDGDWLLAVMLTSRDHDLDAAQEQRAGRETASGPSAVVAAELPDLAGGGRQRGVPVRATRPAWPWTTSCWRPGSGG